MTDVALGPIRVEGQVRVAGSLDAPIPFAVAAVCVGTTVTIAPTIMQFGHIQMLHLTSHKVTLTNTSLIPATVTVGP
jgi:hypothetical protein